MSPWLRREIRERETRDRASEHERKRRAWRPADYEPDFDGPIRQDTTEGSTDHSAWRLR